MGKFKDNRIVLGTFAILMVVGLMAAYIPMLFPPSAVPDANVPEENANTADTNDYAAQLPKNVNTPTTTVTSTLPTKASLPDSLSGFQDEQKSLDDLGNLLK